MLTNQRVVAHADLSGIMNASSLYSFTVGIPSLAFGGVYIYTPQALRSPAPCEVDPADMCTIAEDFNRPHVRNTVVYASMCVSAVSLGFSIINMFTDISALLFKYAEAEEEAAVIESDCARDAEGAEEEAAGIDSDCTRDAEEAEEEKQGAPQYRRKASS